MHRDMDSIGIPILAFGHRTVRQGLLGADEGTAHVANLRVRQLWATVLLKRTMPGSELYIYTPLGSQLRPSSI